MNKVNTDKKVADFMTSFLSSPEPEIDKEYFEIEEMYNKRFGHNVPRAMLPDALSMDDIKTAMKECLKTDRDNLFVLLGIDVDNEYLY